MINDERFFMNENRLFLCKVCQSEKYCPCRDVCKSFDDNNLFATKEMCCLYAHLKTLLFTEYDTENTRDDNNIRDVEANYFWLFRNSIETAFSMCKIMKEYEKDIASVSHIIRFWEQDIKNNECDFLKKSIEELKESMLDWERGRSYDDDDDDDYTRLKKIKYTLQH